MYGPLDLTSDVIEKGRWSIICNLRYNRGGWVVNNNKYSMQSRSAGGPLYLFVDKKEEGMWSSNTELSDAIEKCR